jgi:hypothetical protein
MMKMQQATKPDRPVPVEPPHMLKMQSESR